MKNALLIAGLLIVQWSSAGAAEMSAAQREAAIRSKLMQIIVPRLDLREASIREALDFLKAKSVQLDPGSGQEIVNVTLKIDGSISPTVDPNVPMVTLCLANIPIWEALRYMAEIGHLKMRIGERALELSPDDAIASPGKAPARSAGPVAAKLAQIIIPKLEFREASLIEALDFLRFRAAALDQAEPDPRKRGVNLVYVPPLTSSKAAAPPKLSLTQTNVALGEVLGQIAALAGVEMAVEEYAVVLRARSAKP
jgi:hypothetical protein